MKALVLDTNVIIDAFHGDERFRKVMASARKLIVSPVVYAEFMAGFDNSRAGCAAKDRFRKFLELPSVEIPTIGLETAEIHASIRRQLKSAGTPIPQNDIWIAAVAMEHGAAVCTTDEHFKAVINLRVIDRGDEAD